MEKLNVKRTTKYGIQLSDESYRNTSEPVRKFLAGKLPAEIEVVESEGKEITKVKILGKTTEASNTNGMSSMNLLNNKTNARICALNNAVLMSDTKTKEEVLALADELVKFIEK